MHTDKNTGSRAEDRQVTQRGPGGLGPSGIVAEGMMGSPFGQSDPAVTDGYGVGTRGFFGGGGDDPGGTGQREEIVQPPPEAPGETDFLGVGRNSHKISPQEFWPRWPAGWKECGTHEIPPNRKPEIQTNRKNPRNTS